MDIQSKQAEFMVAAGQQLVTLKQALQKKAATEQSVLYMNLCEEEFHELEAAFSKYDKAVREDERLACMADVADAVCDLAVVMMGLCNSMGIPFGACFEEVHRSNMSKCVKGDDGAYTVLKRADGKVIKPKDFVPPNLTLTLRYYLIRGY